MSTITRFAPSPTGMLHIGGARTALFTLLYARHTGGKALLRIDDTDRERSTEAAVQAIFEGLDWLGLKFDGEPVFQHQRLARHVEVAEQLLAAGKAYRCYATAEELEEMRKAAARRGLPPRYDGRWRDRDPSEAPAGAPFVIRLKTPRTGSTIIPDRVHSTITFANSDLDDFILLRGDGSPTYMLSTVVDDIDMGVTHIIRGDDHMTNAARQAQIYDALGVARPVYAHIPLIHGPDGQKLSKRHGAVGIGEYRDQGFLPEAVVSYLMGLGWASGLEHPTMESAAPAFDLSHLGKSPARLDADALVSANFHFMKHADDARLAELILPHLGRAPDDPAKALLTAAMPGLKERAKTVPHLAETAAFYLAPRPIPVEEAAQAVLTEDARARVSAVFEALQGHADWSHDALAALVKAQAKALDVPFVKLGQPLRAALTGRTNSPGVAEVMALLGREESLGRLADALS